MLRLIVRILRYLLINMVRIVFADINQGQIIACIEDQGYTINSKNGNSKKLITQGTSNVLLKIF